MENLDVRIDSKQLINKRHGTKLVYFDMEKKFEIVYKGYTAKYGAHVTVAYGRERFYFKDEATAKDFIKMQTKREYLWH